MAGWSPGFALVAWYILLLTEPGSWNPSLCNFPSELHMNTLPLFILYYFMLEVQDRVKLQLTRWLPSKCSVGGRDRAGDCRPSCTGTHYTAPHLKKSLSRNWMSVAWRACLFVPTTCPASLHRNCIKHCLAH